MAGAVRSPLAPCSRDAIAERGAGGRQAGDGPPERLGRYRLLEAVGAGGFGTVYRGYDDELRRYVAIKVPHPRLTWTAHATDAYLNEARVLAGLDHPGIVPVYDFG